MKKPTIGFIGLGLMGGNMVENLQKRGFELIVIDLNKEEVAKVIARGNATEASSPKELAAKSDIIMFCLTTSAVVEKIVYGEEGILAGIREGAVLIDFGTSIPASTIKIGKALAEKGAGMIDAPLGRTPAHAKDGLLNIMAAGNKDTFEKREHYIFQEGKTVFKNAVSNMADVAEKVLKRNNLTNDDITWLAAHQANKRIIEATANRIKLDSSKVMMNIQNYGNTTSATLPLLIADYEKQLKKGDKIIFAAFGGGFTWASIYLKWAYNS